MRERFHVVARCVRGDCQGAKLATALVDIMRCRGRDQFLHVCSQLCGYTRSVPTMSLS